MGRLLVTRRRVPAAGTEAYRAAWRAVVDAAMAVGAHAWLFQDPADAERFCEFIEWKDNVGNVMERDDVRRATSRLETLGVTLDSEHWQEPWTA